MEIEGNVFFVCTAIVVCFAITGVTIYNCLHPDAPAPINQRLERIEKHLGLEPLK